MFVLFAESVMRAKQLIESTEGKYLWINSAICRSFSVVKTNGFAPVRKTRCIGLGFGLPLRFTKSCECGFAYKI
ncbi:MAG: hypothetical protein EGQ35_08300 [Clostridiales bacterium]|nr:hypothetical protein [Clostridiales bacterium]